MLEVDSITVRYGGTVAVRELSLSVGEGEIVGLLGANGAGKTSLLSAIGGVVASVGGRFSFDGVDLTGRESEEIARAGITLVPEGRRIFQTLTVEDNLRLGATLHKKASDNAQRLDEVLDLFPVLRRLYGTPAGNLSGGEQQQLAIARALMSRPKLLAIDEPSMGLAPKVVEAVFDSLATLRERGLALLVVEQSSERILGFADRTHVLRRGSIALTVESGQDLDDAALQSAYFGTTVAGGAA